jgi:hypothetical protein
MQKLYFHNGKSISKNTKTKIFSQVQDISQKQVVDINKLLNRVKKDQKDETKRKIILSSFVILGISSLGTLISFLK